MCLSIPARIIEVNDDRARAQIGGNVVEIGLHLVDDVKVDDYVLVHTGYALQKISEKEAQETLKLIQEYEDFNQELDEKEKDWRNPTTDI